MPTGDNPVCSHRCPAHGPPMVTYGLQGTAWFITPEECEHRSMDDFLEWAKTPTPRSPTPATWSPDDVEAIRQRCIDRLVGLLVAKGWSDESARRFAEKEFAS